MSFTTYSLYLAAVAVLVLSPGPTMLTCITTALNDGKSSALAAAAGSISAVLGVMTLSAVGLGALLAASEFAFTTVKTIGAIYLIWLGIKTFRSDTGVTDIKKATADSRKRLRSPYARGFLVGSSNPKAILFFTAFFPQFLNPMAPFAPQYAILALTFVTFEFSRAGCMRLRRLRRCAPAAVKLAHALDQQGNRGAIRSDGRSLAV